MTFCPCGSQQPYELCCGPFLERKAKAPTAEALMRSRYTAYTRKDSGYLLRTWHPAKRPHPGSLGLQEEVTWSGLEIVCTKDGGVDDEQGTVEFVASYSSLSQKEEIHEKSTFIRQDGQWLYVNGEIYPKQIPQGVKVGRNEPCPCGSGKKYKKCCSI